MSNGENKDIACVKRDIQSKESRGEDASYERGLLKEWAKYPGWEDAGNVPAPQKVKSA